MRRIGAFYSAFLAKNANGNRKPAADYLGHSVSNLTERVYVTRW